MVDASSSLVAVAVGLVFILGLNIWSPRLGFLRGGHLPSMWFVFATLAWGIFALQDSALTGLRRTIWVPVENTLFGIAKIVLLLLLARPFQQYGIFASWTISMAAAIVPVNLLIFKHFLPEHVRVTQTRAVPITPVQLFRYAASDYVGSLFYLASTTLLPLIVTQLDGARANAYFYLAWIIACSLQTVSMNMAISLTVEGAGDHTILDIMSCRFLIHMMRLVAPMVAIVILGAPYMLRLFGHVYATEGSLLLRLLALSALPSTVNSLYWSVCRVTRHMIGIVVTQGLLCVLTLGLSVILIRFYGISGVGLAWLAGQTIVAVGLMSTQLRPVLRPLISRRSVRAP